MANYNLSLPAETIDSLLLWLDDKQDVIIKQTDLLSGTGQSTTATMTQKAITDALGTKADASSVYTKTQTDNLLNAKADKSTTYTKTETDELIAPLATQEDVQAVEQEVAQIAGEAGLAEAVIDTDNAGTEQELTFRKSGGDGGAYYRKIKGKTLAWNQHIQMPEQGDAHGWILLQNPVYNADGSFTLTPTDDWGGGVYDAYVSIVGHKYYVRSGIQCTGIMRIFMGGTYITSDSTHPTKTYVSAVFEATSAGGLSLWGTQGVPATFWDIEVIDLTLMFGAGNEPSTVAEFEALYPGYYPYNPGTLISNDAEAVETTGVNQWDEDVEEGYYDTATGAPEASSNFARCKNFIPVIAGETYVANIWADGWVLEYDANKNYLGIYTTIPTFIAGKILSANTRYITFYATKVSLPTNGFCINFSNPAINGQYFPYWKRTLQLGITTKEDTDGNVPFADGMKGAGTAADWADKVGGEKRMGRVDLGSLEWIRSGNHFSVEVDLGQKIPASDNSVAQMVCAIYSNTYANYIYADQGDKLVAIGSGNWIYVIDSAYTDAAAFTAAMNGVYLDYELATPVPFTWAEPLNLGVKVDENGTERAVAPEGATAPSAPFVADTTYTMSVARMVEILKNL